MPAVLERTCGPAPRGGVPGAPRARHVVGDPARSAEPLARRPLPCARSKPPSTPPPRGPRREPRAGRGLVLSRRRARRPRAVARAARGAPRRPRATASASRPRSSAPSRSIRSCTTRRFGIGAYRYYADIAPAYLRWLRWLLLLPGGDRAGGLAQMERASRDGRAGAGPRRSTSSTSSTCGTRAASWRRSRWCAGCRERYPRNPLFRQIEAEILDVYVHDAAGSLAASRNLLDAAEHGEVNRADAGRGAGAPQHRGAARSAGPSRSCARDARRAARAGARTRRSMPWSPRPRVAARVGAAIDDYRSRALAPTTSEHGGENRPSKNAFC